MYLRFVVLTDISDPFYCPAGKENEQNIWFFSFFVIEYDYLLIYG